MPLEAAQQQKLVCRLIQRHTIYRFRDARLQQHPLQLQAVKVSKKLAPEILDQFAAVMSLLRYYFIPENERLAVVGDTSILWQKAKKLAGTVASWR